MPPVILWDVDGTLIRTRGGRVSLTAFLVALKRVTQHHEDFEYPKDPGGKTDEQIALEVLTLARFAEERALALLADFREAYRIELEAERPRLLQDLRILPGVEETLATFQRQGVTQSLLTGNLEPIARLKLEAIGLDRYVDFELGAYGSDHRDRTRLVPISRSRIVAATGAAPDPVVVIGDTPRDVACARAGGAVAVAVATGTYDRATLEASAPDLVLDDLTDAVAALSPVLGRASAIQ